MLNYKPLWKLLIDRDMKRKDFMIVTEISQHTYDRMARGDAISFEMLDRICTKLRCNVADVIQHVAASPESEP